MLPAGGRWAALAPGRDCSRHACVAAVRPQVSLAFQLEPAFGTLLGWMSGVVAAPGWATWVGGLIVFGATCAVTVASTRREARKEAKGQAVVELENVSLCVGTRGHRALDCRRATRCVENGMA